LNSYRLLSTGAGAPPSVLTASPPVTVFSGLFFHFLRLEPFPLIVAFCNLLCKFIPILLSNIPFSPIQTWELHLVCAWTTVGCLLFVNLVLLWGLVAVGVPAMPVDPGGLAGRVYYLCDPKLEEVVNRFTGMGRVGEKEGRRKFLSTIEK